MNPLKNLSLNGLQEKKKHLEETVNLTNAEIAIIDQELSGRPNVKPMTLDEMLEVSIAFNRLWRAAEQLCPETMGRFFEDTKNFQPFYDNTYNLLKYEYYVYSQKSILPCFHTEELIIQFISENEADLRTVFKRTR